MDRGLRPDYHNGRICYHHDVLGSVDRWLLLKINRDWTAPSLDALLPVLTDLHRVPWFLYGVGPALIALWLWKGQKRALRVLIVAAIAIGVGDFLSYRVIKPSVARLRPDRAGVAVILRAPARGTWTFPSNHAVNAAAAASVLSVAYPAGAYAFAGVAILIAYSRVYVGAHYPADVIGGLIIGVLLGWPWAVIMLRGDKGSRSSKKKRR